MKGKLNSSFVTSKAQPESTGQNEAAVCHDLGERREMINCRCG